MAEAEFVRKTPHEGGAVLKPRAWLALADLSCATFPQLGRCPQDCRVTEHGGGFRRALPFPMRSRGPPGSPALHVCPQSSRRGLHTVTQSQPSEPPLKVCTSPILPSRKSRVTEISWFPPKHAEDK